MAISLAAAVGACAPPESVDHGHDPLAPYDAREDAVVDCDDWGAAGPARVWAAGSACDPTRFGDDESAIDGPTYSLCACGDIDARNTVTSTGSGSPWDDIGANHGWRSSAPVDIAGLLVSGADVHADNTLATDGLLVDGILSGSSDVHIRGDAIVGGMAFPSERVTVDGALTHPSGAAMDGLASAGTIETADVDVPPPCACDDDDGDDDVFADFDPVDPDPDALVGLSLPTTIYLGCADHRFSAIEANNVLDIVVVGHTRLWIDGDVRVAGPFTIDIEDGASLELYVGGSFEPTNTVTMGNPADPAALRMRIGDHARLASPWVLHGSVFAPDADVIVDNTLELGGAIMAQRFTFASPVSLGDGPRFTGDACVIAD